VSFLSQNGVQPQYLLRSREAFLFNFRLGIAVLIVQKGDTSGMVLEVEKKTAKTTGSNASKIYEKKRAELAASNKAQIKCTIIQLNRVPQGSDPRYGPMHV